ncbi:MAG: tryptophan synthase subunit alpha [Solirubrobacterales bacterium]|nr:tryptophan synthase subunit alpha [Solirubrobacterales bacterium]
MPEGTKVAGAERIAGAFSAAREEGRAALMPYLMGGFPDTEGAVTVAEAYADAGADLIELGIPFSDPLADGPVIHAAATSALERGATVETALEVCSAVADRLPVITMVYSNMILAGGGAEAFAARIAEAGAAGAIVPDLPLEEAGPVRVALGAQGLPLVPLIAPTTPPERRRTICAGAAGFVYLVSTVGVTGEREDLPPELTDLIAAAKEEADVPVAVGFGIATPDQAGSVGGMADGVIIGTRLVRAVADAPDARAAGEAVGSLLREFRSALEAGS